MATGGNFSTSSIYRAGHEEYFEYACAPCTDDGRNSEAVKFCENCSHYLCTKCFKDHNRFPALRNHKVLDAAAMSGPQPAKFIPTEPCPSHNGGLIDTYCGDHDDVCCPTCVALNHRACKDINYLPLVAKGIKKSNEYKSIMNGMVKVKLQLENLKRLKQDDKNRLENEMSACLTKIKDYRTKINKHLDDLEKTAENEICYKHKEFEARLNADINNLEQMVSSLEASIDQLEKTNTDNEPQLFVSVKMGKRNQTDGNKLAQKTQASRRQENLNFHLNKSIEEFLKNLKSLGDFPQETQNAVPNTAVLQKTQDDIRYTASMLGKYDVKVGDERSCDIKGSCLLDDNTLLIADYENFEIKRLNSSYKVIDHIKLPGPPWAVCATGSAEAAVTLVKQKKITFISLGSKMTLTRSINVREYCRGVAYSYGELFVCCGGSVIEVEGQVRTYNTAGQLLRTVLNDSTGQQMFSIPWNVAVSSDGTLIHVADRDNGVITLTRQGNKHSQFSDPKLQKTLGVCQGDNDQLFACDGDSHNILQFSKSGQKLAILLDSSHGVKSPWSICYDPARTRLIVTMYNSPDITVYNLTRK